LLVVGCWLLARALVTAAQAVMTVRWSPEAADDFATIVEFLRKQNPSAAERVALIQAAGCVVRSDFS
jgi:hypothetical protein